MRRFDGWEPAERTTYEYDETGRLVASTTVREAEWDAEQQAWMVALGVYRSQIHEPCGGYLPETTAADAEDGYQADLPIRCHLCTARLRQYGKYQDSSTPQIDALLWPVVRRG